MRDQLAFPGFDPVPMRTPRDRLFFALFPDATRAARIALLAQDLRGVHALRGAALKTERFHITLCHLGDYRGLPHDVVNAAREAAAALVSPSFDVLFDRVESFRGGSRGRPLVLRGGDGLAALTAFQRVLDGTMVKAGLGRAIKSSYAPHVTLLYDDRSVEAQTVDPIGWTANEFVLVHSLLGQTRHIPLGRWPLRG